jgi:hypothetical protein
LVNEKVNVFVHFDRNAASPEEVAKVQLNLDCFDALGMTASSFNCLCISEELFSEKEAKERDYAWQKRTLHLSLRCF